MRYMIPLLFLIGCVASYTTDTQFHNEFDWDRPITLTPVMKIPVSFPSWLADEDKPTVLEAIDTYAIDLMDSDEWVHKYFDFRRYTVWIHDSLGGFVAGSASNPVWASGWALGDKLIVSWGYETDQMDRPIGLAIRNILPALTHEWYHVILNERYGYADAGHFVYFPTPEVRMGIITPMIRALQRDPIKLSEKTTTACKKFRYYPWVIPGAYK